MWPTSRAKCLPDPQQQQPKLEQTDAVHSQTVLNIRNEGSGIIIEATHLQRNTPKRMKTLTRINDPIRISTHKIQNLSNSKAIHRRQRNP